MSTSIVEHEIREFIARNFPLSARGAEIALEDSLVESGVIDSAGVLELVEFIDGVEYDGKKPNDYLSKFPIGLKGNQTISGGEVVGG